MKNYKIIYIILLGISLWCSSCQKNTIAVKEANLNPVSNLKYTLLGDSVLLSWNLPQGNGPLTVTVNDSTNTTTLAANAVSFKYGIVQTNKKYVFIVKVSDNNGNSSLGQIVRFTRDGAAPVKNASGLQTDNNVTVSWTAPDLPVTKITIKMGNQSVDVGPTVTSYQFKNVPIGAYNITFVTTNSSNQLSNTVILPFKVGATSVAYIGMYTDSLTLLNTGDDDEVAGAKWLFKNYTRSKYVSFSQVKNGTVDLSQFRVIWWNYDLVSTTSLPAIATDAAVVAKMTQFYKNGGSLLLNQYAVQYLWTVGRMTVGYPMGVDSGPGGNNPDIWGVGVNINEKHDQSGHPLYKGITMTKQGDSRITFPTIGPGWKENHNDVIVTIPDFLKLGPNNNEAAYTKFVTDNNVEWLGQWDGIGDYYMAGILEFKPMNDYQGSAIFIGIGAVEWNQNSGTNPYQSNIELLYKNAIDYLKTK
ncbi:uncharacterized protein DUF4960 [Mucilaginibacter gracilis]|uniref:Uncharacterized protein DUF4960 n=1 Tax=Mucilaginibacter gracilis TaxID=423350 RepID=A0A495IV05_9SPHI|nr:DUF4960 domain-containing protein [Mucilaginibacter gracilis]RKR80141.1 uncharacterized protein DUF4960 [Mucilaginibacter gracilis]